MFNLKFNKFTKDFQWSFISLITASLVHLLLRILLSKELGPSGLGIYTLIFTIYMFGTQFAGFGIGSSLTQYVAEYRDNLPKTKEFISSGIIGSIISGSIMGVVLYIFSNTISTHFFHNPSMTNLLKYTAFCFPFISIQKTVIGILNGLREMKSYALVNIIQNASIFVATISLVHIWEMNINGAVLGFIIPTIIIGLLSLLFVRDLLTLSPKIKYDVFKELSFFGFYVVLANSIGMINTEIDSLMIGHFMNETEVGYYAAAIIFIQGVTLLPEAMQKVTTPIIATYYGKRDFENIRLLLKKTMFKVILITILIDIFIIAFGKILIELIFTKEFFPAYAPLLILLVGYSVYAPFMAVGTCLSSIGKVQIIFKISALCAGLNTILNIILISKFGLNGAACATSISLLFTTAINLYLIDRYTSKKSNIFATHNHNVSLLYK